MSQTFEGLGLAASFVQQTAVAGFDAPTLIQRAAIPVLRRGSNAVVHAASGSGVTAAVVLALLDRLTTEPAPDAAAADGVDRPRALIVAVTDERASAIARTAARLGTGSAIRCRAMDPTWSVRGPADVLIGSLQSVLAAIRGSTLKLDRLEALVLDRADALLDLDDAGGIEAIGSAARAEAQRVVVAGQRTKAVERFVDAHVRRAIAIPPRPADPALAGPPAPAGALSYLVVARNEKPAALARMLRRSRAKPPLVLVRSAARAAGMREELALRGFRASGDNADVRIEPFQLDSGARIACDVPADAATLADMDLADGIVMIEPAELTHLRTIAAEAGITLSAVGTTRAARGSVARYREVIRRAIEEQDLDAQLALLDPLFEEFPAAEVAAALSALLRQRRAQAEAAAPARTEGPEPFVRLFISIGQRDNIRPGDLLGAITGEASVRGDQVGKIEIRDTFSVVEVVATEADRIVKALNGTTLRGRSLRVDYDRRSGATPPMRPRRVTRPQRN